MVPVRALGNSLGASVDWDDKTKTVIFQTEDKLLELPINSFQARVNGRMITLDQGAVLKNARSYVPIRFISEQLDAKVTWLPEEREVLIER